MKKLALTLTIAALAAMAAPFAAAAQSASGSVGASATIQGFLEVYEEENLAFGTLLPTEGTTLTPGAAPGAGQTMGLLRILHNADVSISAVVPTGLSLGGQPDLPVSFSCGFSSTAAGALDGAAAACASLPNRNGNGDGTTRTSYLQMGGAILGADTADRVPGTYTGTVVFTVTSVY
jgi:hypothetical protein